MTFPKVLSFREGNLRENVPPVTSHLRIDI
jgi:hypothetical protein